MENAAKDIPMGTKQFIDSVITQSTEFQAGLDVVVSGAIQNQIQPYAIAIGCVSSAIRITGAVGLSAGMSFDDLKTTLAELLESLSEDYRSAYEALAQGQAS